ncbi:sll1863 family stress response protein [Nitrococcus mobilis]
MPRAISLRSPGFKPATTTLTDIGHSSESAWNDIKAGADQAWERLSEAMGRARSHF